MASDMFIQILLTAAAAMISWIFMRISNDVRRLTESVESLNTKIAVVLERVDHHERRIARLEEK